jgi:hypothetical protein
MPHLAGLQAEYKDKGVTIIGFTARDILGKPGHTEKDVADFVSRRGKQFGYTFAYSDDATTTGAWMTAAGREGIPCTFVVDTAGKVAYVGHPMYLPAVLPRVVEGKATAKEIGAEMAKIEAEVRDISGHAFDDPKATLKALKSFEAKHPALADFPFSARIKLSLLPKHGGAGEAKEYAEALVAKAAKKKDVQLLGTVSGILRRGDGKGSKELLAVAVKAAEAEVRTAGDKDARALINLASTHSVAGDEARAQEYARKAVDAAAGESPALKEDIERGARVLGGGKWDKNK